MDNVSQEGRTVLFVSHNMQAIKRLCRTAILLDEGELYKYADAESITNLYLAMSSETQPLANKNIPMEMHKIPPSQFEIFKVELLNRHQEPTTTLLMDETFYIRISYIIHNAEHPYRIGIIFWNRDGNPLATLVSTENDQPHLQGEAGSANRIAIQVQNIFLPGNYTMDIHAKTVFNVRVDDIGPIPFSVEPVSVKTNARYGLGVVQLQAEWSLPPNER
jgi:lipopolysaccharide transport system ATP-binding protein